MGCNSNAVFYVDLAMIFFRMNYYKIVSLWLFFGVFYLPFTYADTEYVYTKSRSCEQGVIRSISIENNNVFDENDDKEDGFFYRMANNLHI